MTPAVYSFAGIQLRTHFVAKEKQGSKKIEKKTERL